MKIHQKIAAILAKAERTHSTEESATFLAKAEQLMKANGIDLVDIELHCEDDPVALEENAVAVSGAWQQHLFSCLARFLYCSTVTHRWGSRSKRLVTISGRESHRETLKLMWPYILKSVGREASEMRKSGEALGSPSVVKREVSDALIHRICTIIQQREIEFKTNNSTALIPLNPAVAKIKEHYPDLEPSRSRKCRTTFAAKRRAEKIGLNSQVKSQSKPTQLLIGA